MTGSSYYSVEKHADARSGGSTQAETRIYNERLVLSLVRRHDRLSKAELSKLTGLSAQATSTIVSRLAEDGLVRAGERLRGGMGQPSVPYALNPDGAWALGLTIRAGGAELVLVDFLGRTLARKIADFAHPVPEEVVRFAEAAASEMLRGRDAGASERIVGLGIASPFQDGWMEMAEMPPKAVAQWRRIDIRAELDARLSWPVYLCSEATMAASAELLFGAGRDCTDFLYVHLGEMMGGGLVLDGELHSGRNRMAAAIGSTPHGTASLAEAGSMLLAPADGMGASRSNGPGDGPAFGARPPALADWIDNLAAGLETLALSTIALLDIDTLIVDGDLSPDLRTRICRALRQRLATSTLSRPEPFTVIEGRFGPSAASVGGATVPFLVRFANGRETLFKG